MVVNEKGAGGMQCRTSLDSWSFYKAAYLGRMLRGAAFFIGMRLRGVCQRRRHIAESQKKSVPFFL
jgi:hypothetical protein